jgi:hypothetical protein
MVRTGKSSTSASREPAALCRTPSCCGGAVANHVVAPFPMNPLKIIGLLQQVSQASVSQASGRLAEEVGPVPIQPVRWCRLSCKAAGGTDDGQRTSGYELRLKA